MGQHAPPHKAGMILVLDIARDVLEKKIVQSIFVVQARTFSL